MGIVPLSFAFNHSLPHGVLSLSSPLPSFCSSLPSFLYGLSSHSSASLRHSLSFVSSSLSSLRSSFSFFRLWKGYHTKGSVGNMKEKREHRWIGATSETT